MTVLRDSLIRIRDHGFQPMYNGRPSCPFCTNFVDDEETHRPTCVLLSPELDALTDIVAYIRASEDVPEHVHSYIDARLGERKPLWGEDGPKIGQVIELPDIPGTSVRWNGTYWEPVK